MYFESTPAATSVWRKVCADLLVAESAALLELDTDITVASKRTASGTTVAIPVPVTLTKRTAVDGFWLIAIASTEKVRIAKNIPRKIFISNLPTYH